MMILKNVFSEMSDIKDKFYIVSLIYFIVEKIRNDRKAHTHNRNVICHYLGITIDFCDFLNSLLTVCVYSLVAQMVKNLPAM